MEGQILITSQSNLLVVMIDGNVIDLTDKEEKVREKLLEIKEILG